MKLRTNNKEYLEQKDIVKKEFGPFQAFKKCPSCGRQHGFTFHLRMSSNHCLGYGQCTNCLWQSAERLDLQGAIYEWTTTNSERYITEHSENFCVFIMHSPDSDSCSLLITDQQEKRCESHIFSTSEEMNDWWEKPCLKNYKCCSTCRKSKQKKFQRMICTNLLNKNLAETLFLLSNPKRVIKSECCEGWESNNASFDNSRSALLVLVEKKRL